MFIGNVNKNKKLHLLHQFLSMKHGIWRVLVDFKPPLGTYFMRHIYKIIICKINDNALIQCLEN